MNEDQGKKDQNAPWSELMESATNYWTCAVKNWQDLSSSLAGAKPTDDCMNFFMQMWQKLLAQWTGAEACKGAGASQPLFDIGQALMRVMSCGGGGMSQEFMQWLWKPMESSGFNALEDLQREAFKIWTGFHEKQVQPILKMPQVGLTRVFQERINLLVDKFGTYQATVAEFQNLLSRPMEQSFAVMRQEMKKMKEKGEDADDFKKYYSMWIKVLEENYMTLFRSEEYRHALAKLLDETATFRMTGNEVIADFLQVLPIPTNKDMDEVYKELYQLKKQNKESLKKIKELQSAVGQN